MHIISISKYYWLKSCQFYIQIRGVIDGDLIAVHIKFKREVLKIKLKIQTSAEPFPYEILEAFCYQESGQSGLDN